MLKPPLELEEGGVMGGQLPSKAHVNFRQFPAVFGVACKLPCTAVNLKFHDNLQCRILTKIPLFMPFIISQNSLQRLKASQSCLAVAWLLSSVLVLASFTLFSLPSLHPEEGSSRCDDPLFDSLTTLCRWICTWGNQTESG